MSWFTESFLLLQLAPHNPSEEATSLGAPSSTSITALKGRCRFVVAEQAALLRVSGAQSLQAKGYRLVLAWGGVGVTGVESLSSHPAICGCRFPGPTHPTPLVRGSDMEKLDAHFLALKSGVRESSPAGAGRACSSAVLSKQNCFCLVLRMLFSSNKLWCGSSSNTFFWHLLGSSLWM